MQKLTQRVLKMLVTSANLRLTTSCLWFVPRRLCEGRVAEESCLVVGRVPSAAADIAMSSAGIAMSLRYDEDEEATFGD